MQKDIALKQLAEHEDVFAEVFNQLAFGGKNIITSSELTAIPTEAKEGIGALIKLCKDFQVSRQDTLQKILENFSLPQTSLESEDSILKTKIRSSILPCLMNLKILAGQIMTRTDI